MVPRGKQTGRKDPLRAATPFFSKANCRVFSYRGVPSGLLTNEINSRNSPSCRMPSLRHRPLGREVIVLHIGVNAPGIFLPEQEIYISKGRFVGIAFSAPLGKKIPAHTEGVPFPKAEHRTDPGAGFF